MVVKVAPVARDPGDAGRAVLYRVGTRVIARERGGAAVGKVTAVHEGGGGRRYAVRLGAFPGVPFAEEALARYTAARYDALARGEDLLLRAFRAEDRAACGR